MKEGMSQQPKKSEVYEKATAGSLEEAKKLITDQKVELPALLVPFGQDIDVSKYVVTTLDELERVFDTALDAAVYDARVHIISVAQRHGDYWKTNQEIKPIKHNDSVDK